MNINFLLFGEELPLESMYKQLAILYKCKVLQISVIEINIVVYLWKKQKHLYNKNHWVFREEFIWKDIKISEHILGFS